MCFKKLMDIFITSEHQQLTNSQPYKGEWSLYLILAGVITTVGSSVPVGYNISVINTPAKVIIGFCVESFITRYNVYLDEKWQYVLWSFVVSIFIVGGCIGSILGSVLADALGRKMAIVVTNLLAIAGGILFVFCNQANSVEMLVLGRLLVGLAGGLTTSIVPMYLTELAPSRLVGAMGAICPMGVNLGVLIGQVMGLNFLLGRPQDWHYLISAFGLLVIISMPLLLILPESPKYLFVIKRDEEKALKELSRLRGVSTSVLTVDVDVLREEVQNNELAAVSGDNKWTMIRVLKDKRLLLPLLLACSMQAGQQTSGINAVFYYSQIMFLESGFSEAQAQYATIGCGFINVCTAVLMMYMLPKFDRRPLLLGSIGVVTLILTALAVCMLFLKSLVWMQYICMALVLAYVLVYGFGLGPIPYFIGSELFEVGPRPAGMAWGSLANWGGNFLVGMSFPSMNTAIGSYSFLIFAGITAALFVFQKMYFPETRRRTPAQVSQMCSGGLSSRPRARINVSDTVSA